MSEDTPQSVRIERHGDVAEVIVNNPPVNALSWHVRQGLDDSFAELMADDLREAAQAAFARLRRDGGEFRAPMAVAVIGGLIVATIMTLYVLPAISHLILRKRGEAHQPGDFEDGIPGSEPLPA